MNLYAEVYKIQDTELKKDEKEAFIHFLWNLWSSLNLIKSQYDEEILQLVRKVYDWYIADWNFRKALVKLAKETKNWNTESLKNLPKKYYRRYFKRLLKIKQELIEAFFKSH
jgi:hypothetical protein